jgi:hypothetical protein
LLLTPAEKLMDFVGTGTVAMSAGFQRSQFGPAPIAIQDHGDVLGLLKPCDFFEDATTVEAIEKTFTEEIPKPLHRTKLVLSRRLSCSLQQHLEFLGSSHKVKA